MVHVYPFASPFELISNFAVGLYVHPWPKHKSLSLSQVMEHHYTYLQWGCFGGICGRFDLLVLIEGINFPYHMGYYTLGYEL